MEATGSCCWFETQENWEKQLFGDPHHGWVSLVQLHPPRQILSPRDLFPVFFSRHDVRILIT